MLLSRLSGCKETEMLRKTQIQYGSFPEEHHIPTPYRFFGGTRGAKWITLRGPLLGRIHQASEWTHGFSEFHVEAQPRSPVSDDELFRQAAVKVGHKIKIDRKILGGAPCIAGTRIPVYSILQLLEAGYSRKRILKSFPSLSPEDLEAALRFAVIVMER